MDNFWFALGLTAFAGLSTGIGSAIAFFAKRTNYRFLSVATGFPPASCLIPSAENPPEGNFTQPEKGVELGNMPAPQLYDLSQDIGQIRNLADEQPEKGNEMQARLNAIAEAPGTRLGYSPM